MESHRVILYVFNHLVFEYEKFVHKYQLFSDRNLARVVTRLVAPLFSKPLNLLTSQEWPKSAPYVRFEIRKLV